MKRFFWTLAVLMLLSAVSMAQVGAPSSPFSFYGGGAISKPTSPSGFSDGWKLGYHWMVGVGYNVAPRLQLIGKLENHNFRSSVETSGGSTVDGGAFKSLMYGVDGRLNLGAPLVPLKPYALGGIGMATFKNEQYTSPNPSIATALNTGVSTETFSKAYFNLGGGVEFAMGPKTSLFVQARYVSIASQGGATTFIPVTLGLKLF